jgi:hypothetical protein
VPMRMHGQKSRRTKLVHNIVLSMPSPTPPEKVLAAAWNSPRKVRIEAPLCPSPPRRPAAPARPHVRQSRGRTRPAAPHRQGNAPPLTRGLRAKLERARNSRGLDAALRARSKQRQDARRASTEPDNAVPPRRYTSALSTLPASQGGRFLPRPGTSQIAGDPQGDHRKLARHRWHPRRAGETSLANEVRYFSRNLPRVLTDKERVAAAFIQHLANNRQTSPPEIARSRGKEFTRQVGYEQHCAPSNEK